MPNWVKNRIVFGDKESYDEFRKRFVTVGEDGEPHVDFNRVFPMPAPLEIPCSSTIGDGVGAYLYEARKSGMDDATLSEYVMAVAPLVGTLEYWFFQDVDLALTDEGYEQMKADYEKRHLNFREAVENGGKALRNLVEYGHPTWYQWCVAVWGTKWNASGTILFDDDLAVEFETAWDAPIPVIEKIDEEIGIATYGFADEDIGRNCGGFIHFMGQKVYVNPPERTYHAIKMGVTLWGLQDSYVDDPENHTIRPADDEGK